MRLIVLLLIGGLFLSGCSTSSVYKDEAGLYVTQGTCPIEYKIVQEDRLRCYVLKDFGNPVVIDLANNGLTDVNGHVYRDVEVSCPEACVSLLEHSDDGGKT